MEEMIKLTADYPSNDLTGRVPILDMEVWISKDQEGVSKIRSWLFYEKKMKNRFVMMRESTEYGWQQREGR